MFSVKKVEGMKLNFMKGKGSKPDFFFFFFLGSKNKVMGTESGNKVCEK